MARSVEAEFGCDTYAMLSRCAACGRPYDRNCSDWTTTFTTEGDMKCWLLFCTGCAEEMEVVGDENA